MSKTKLLLKSAITLSLTALFSASPQILSAAERNNPLPAAITGKTGFVSLGQFAGDGQHKFVQLAQNRRRSRRSRKRTRRSRRSRNAATAGAASGIQGRYAVLREKNKDAGCLVSLNRSGRAQVGPGCSDHGFQVFDPIRWSYSGGTLILRGRSGHRVPFARKPSGIWQRSPAGEKALGLKKY